jgi:hypothetical protein
MIEAKDVDILYDLGKRVNIIRSHVDNESPAEDNYPQVYPQVLITLWMKTSYPRANLIIISETKPSWQRDFWNLST